MAESFKRQIRFAVTGAAGFIGARLASKLIQDEHWNPEEVLLVDSMADFDRRACVLGQENLRGAAKMDSELFRTEFVARAFPNLQKLFHMGACSRTDETRWSYLEKVNLQYSKDLWNQCALQGTSFFYASSGATYGAGEAGYSDEDSVTRRLKPLNLYGQSKQLFDVWALEQRARGNAPLHWAGFKFFNVYGPFEFHKGSQASVLTHAFLQLRKKGRMRLFKSARPDFKDGEQKRDFIYIDDVIHTVARFAERKTANGIYNLGTGRAQTFLDLAQACAEALNVPLFIDWIETPENLRAQYQYFTQAETRKLNDAGVKTQAFLDLRAGAREYWSQWLSLERKGIETL